MDALYINPLGRLILAEFKLWRNPQARREVIGQILDYTKELASWNYEDLQREVYNATLVADDALGTGMKPTNTTLSMREREEALFKRWEQAIGGPFIRDGVRTK